MNLTQLYDSVDRSTLDQWIIEHKPENLNLDFKTIAIADQFNKDDRKNFAKSLSGFANSDGGLIVWGVNARKDVETGIDCAVGLMPVAKSILSILESLTGQAVNPTIDGIRHKFIDNNLTDNLFGYIVTFVPSSERGPHMAKLTEDRYYKRSGDSFYKMEHFDIADMFGRRSRPRIKINFQVENNPNSPLEPSLKIFLHNDGRAVAKHVGFFIKFYNCNVNMAVGNGLNNVSNLNPGIPSVSYSDNNMVFHPNLIKVFIGVVSLRKNLSTDRIIMEISTFAEGMENINELVHL